MLRLEKRQGCDTFRAGYSVLHSLKYPRVVPRERVEDVSSAIAYRLGRMVRDKRMSSHRDANRTARCLSIALLITPATLSV